MEWLSLTQTGNADVTFFLREPIEKGMQSAEIIIKDAA
jgi:hypothetical protein